MINQQLIDYVRTQRTSGVSKPEIIKAASSGGWLEKDVEDAFAAIDGVQVPPPMSPIAPPPPAPRTVLSSITNSAPVKLKKKKGPLFMFFILFILLVLVGTAFYLAMTTTLLDPYLGQFKAYIPALQ